MHFCHARFVLICANGTDPDEMPHYGAFHLDLHCLPKYLFKFAKGLKLKMMTPPN